MNLILLLKLVNLLMDSVTCLGHTELIAHTCIGSPFGVSRDSVVHAYGVDCIYEIGSIVLIGKSVEQYDGIDIPPCKGMFRKRATLDFFCVATPSGPTAGHVSKTINFYLLLDYYCS